jgi:CO/xanthine dehydrogenase Mo-binding subunit
MKDGKLVARKMTNRLDTGAYADIGPRVTKNSGYVSPGPYKFEDAWVDAYCVLTNKPSSGPFRGFGVAQVSWAYENHMDRLAEELGLDAFEFRMMNLLEEGDAFVTGSKMHAVGFKECLQKAARAIDWGKPPPPAKNPKIKVGKGLSVTIKSTATPTTSSAFIRLNDDGSVNVIASAVDMGQGSNTVMAQITAETLGVKYSDILVTHQDTDFTPYDQMTNSSRSTFHVGGAVQKAAGDIRRQVLDLAGRQLEVDPDQLETGDGKIWVRGAPDRSRTFREVVQGYFGMNGGNILGRGVYKVEGGKLNFESGQAEGEMTAVFWFVGAGAAEVEVDTETGFVRVRKLVNSIDVGKALNPLRCEEQIAGSAMMAYGQTFYESLNFDNGQPINPNLADYVLPSFEEIPAVMENIIVETPHKDGPFGAKGTGETSITPPGPAIGNAIYNAVGIRICDLPITPEKILRALREKEGQEVPTP